ncbi:hypothetical protein [uncultured Winogradskyella sp.]|uniref:hypothetical protein n=1 Tax=uncultured Winogradskyella sp. TaxID=395353 RepID=UPI00260F15F9|nr:hypothetical protein [uncultured Winogradskyella sp.]
MKYYCLYVICFLSLTCIAQKEGQSFCGGDNTEAYFPLLESKKIIVWGNTYYTEKKTGIKELNDKTYIEYTQTWESGDIAYLYLRKENGIIYQYEENTEDETIRLPHNFDIGDSWKTASKEGSYEIISKEGKLKTPICNYSNLLVLKSIFKNGNFTFYYLKGYGYVAATVNDNLISFVTPKLNID